MRLRVDVDGYAETLRRLAALGAGLGDLDDAARTVAQYAAHAARAAAPVRTGALRASIRPIIRRNYVVVRAGTARRVPYAVVIERGWPARNIEPAHYMGRAAAGVRARGPSIYQRAVAQLIRRVGLG